MGHSRTLVRALLIIGVLLVVVIGASACSSGDSGAATDPSGAAADTSATTDGGAAESDPTVTLIETKCSMCHSTDRVWSADKTRDEWTATVDRMKTNGLVITDDEYNQILDYLSEQ